MKSAMRMTWVWAAVGLALAAVGVFLFPLALVAAPSDVTGPVTPEVGTVRYVATTGEDVDNDCTSPLTPCRTLQRAIDVAAAGEELRISGGVYTDVVARPAPVGYPGPGVITQAAFLTKSLALRGGYTLDFTGWNPRLYTTTVHAGRQGRGVVVGGASAALTLSHVALTGGWAGGLGGDVLGDVGGSLYVLSGTLVLQDVLVYDNAAGVMGGGLYARAGQLALETTRLISNAAAYGGGGAFIGAEATLVNAILAANHATAAGAQVLLKGGALHGVHVTLAGDTATHASGVHVTANAMNAGAEAGAMLALTNTILVSHTLGLNVNVGNTATLTGVLWYGNVTAAAGGGALAVSRAVTGSPHFVSLSHNDYHLAEDSAAIDAGVATAIARDCDGEWRDAAPDLGADEWTGVCRPLAGLSVQGATSGVAGAPLGFAGVVTPFNVALPVTYTWRATAQLPVTQSGGSAVTVAFTWQLAGTKTVTVTAVNACGTVVAATHQVAVSAGPKQTFLPLLQRSYRPACTPIPGVSYEALWVDRGGAPPPDAEHDPGYNLGLLDYEVTDAYKGLVNYGGDTDPHAPQLVHLFGPPRLPVFSEVYRLYHAYGQPITDWPVTMAGFEVSPLEIIHLPESGYRIEPSTDHQALVIYASEDRIAFNYGRRDTLAGYTIYVDGICVEPTLLALYRQLDAEGRVYLPALSGGEPFGRAHDVEIRVVIRDCGSAMDPRARKDWWKGF